MIDTKKPNFVIEGFKNLTSIAVKALSKLPYITPIVDVLDHLFDSISDGDDEALKSRKEEIISVVRARINNELELDVYISRTAISIIEFK